MQPVPGSVASLEGGQNNSAVVDQGWKDFLTIPNGLSLFRVFLGLCFPWFPASWRLFVVLAAALTDLLDGATGRLFGSCSRIGRVLDPVADKVFVVAVVITLLGEGVLSIGEIALLGVRDLIVLLGTVTGLALGMWSTFRQMAPTLLGKTTTAGQFLFFLVLVASSEHRSLAFILTAALSICAGAQYLWLFLTRRPSETPINQEAKP